MRYLLLALLFAVPVAHAQLVTCSDAVTGQPYAACTHLGSSTVVPPAAGLEVFCSGAVGGASTPGTTLAGCATTQWQSDSYMQSYSWVWTVQGWQRHGSLVFTAPVPVPPPTWTGTSTINWVAPTQNSDGSALMDLAGYRIRFGTAPTALTQSIQVSGAGVNSYVVDGLAPGTWYFTVSSYTSAGVESDPSNVVSKTLVAPAPPPPVVTWVVAPNGTLATRPVYEAILDAAGTATIRGNVEGTAKVGAPCGAEAFKLGVNSYREIAEADVTLASPTYRGRRHTAICLRK